MPTIDIGALESHCKGSEALCVTSLVVDEERMRPGHWLGSVLCVYFSAFTLLVGWQEGHLFAKILSQTRWRKKTKGKPANPGSLGEWP